MPPPRISISAGAFPYGQPLRPAIPKANELYTTSESHSHARSQRFSTSVPRYPRDRNRLRGVSPMRRTGPRHPLSVSKEPLPRPVLDPAKRSKVEVDPDHGLWGFFAKEKSALATPADDAAHGRAWTVEELRRKSWEDIHRLWWICAKERNRIATSSKERDRLKAGFGAAEAAERDERVRRTQQAIKHALTERWYAWDDARRLAMEDESVDLTGEGPAYDFEKDRGQDPLPAESEEVPARKESMASA